MTTEQLDAIATLCERLIDYYPTWEANRRATDSASQCDAQRPPSKRRAHPNDAGRHVPVRGHDDLQGCQLTPA